MNEETILTFNVTNIVSVTIMALIGFLILGLAKRLVSGRMKTNKENS